MTEKGKEEAIRLIEETGLNEDRVLVVYLPDCHESLAGIIAGRIREKYREQVFVLHERVKTLSREAAVLQKRIQCTKKWSNAEIF